MMIVSRMKVLAVEERSRQRWRGGAGPEATFEDVSLGWFVVTDGGTFSVGADRPEFSAGDSIKLSISKIEG